VALLNISEADRLKEVSLAKSEISQRFSDLIYAAQSTVTNDCQELPTHAPEPYSGACDRLKHFLSQMTYRHDDISTSLDLDRLSGWAMELQVPYGYPTGSWYELFDSARRFRATTELFSPVLRTDILRSFILSIHLRYWYFAMAFFVGLRLSKTTAEVLQARAARNK